MTAIPRLKVPVEFRDGRAVTIDQDSVSDLAQCLAVIATYEPGQAPDLPEFGTPPQAFRQDIDRPAIARAQAHWEPRTATRVEVRRDPLDELVARIRVSMGG